MTAARSGTHDAAQRDGTAVPSTSPPGGWSRPGCARSGSGSPSRTTRTRTAARPCPRAGSRLPGCRNGDARCGVGPSRAAARIRGSSLPRPGIRLPSFAVEGRELGRRICPWIEQIGQQPDHFAAVDLVFDHAQDDMPRCCPLLPGQIHPGQVRPVRQVFDQPGQPRRTAPGSADGHRPRYTRHQATPGSPLSMITSIPAAEGASLIASSGSPQQTPSTAASICA